MTIIDPASGLAAQVRAALRFNEIGDASPYRLSFAGKGNSGGSFGAFQNDCYASSGPRQVLWRALVNVGARRADDITAAASRKCEASPLSPADQSTADEALAADCNRPLVDALDERTFAVVLRELGTSIDAAATAGLTVEPGAACAIACWANMTGEPATLNTWLGGQAVKFSGGSPSCPAGPVVTQEDVLRYLAATAFFAGRPHNLEHLRAAIAAGLAV